MAIDLKDNVRVSYDYDMLLFKYDGTAKLRVTTFNASGEIIDNGIWIDMTFTAPQLQALNDAVQALLNDLETEHSVTKTDYFSNLD